MPILSVTIYDAFISLNKFLPETNSKIQVESKNVDVCIIIYLLFVYTCYPSVLALDCRSPFNLNFMILHPS